MQNLNLLVMKNFSAKTFLFAAILAFAAVSCNKVEEPEPLSKEEAMAVLNSMGSDMEVVMNEVTQTKGMVTMSYLMELMSVTDEPELSSKVLVKSVDQLVDNALNLKLKQLNSVSYRSKMDENPDEGFFTGTLTWIHLTGEWQYDPLPEDKLIILFPSLPDKEENDATLTIWDYSEVTYQDEIFPVSLKVSLVIDPDSDIDDDEETVFSVIYSSTLQNNALSNTSIAVELEPFTLNLTLNFNPQVNNLMILFGHELKKEDVKIMSSNIELLIKGITAISPFSSMEIPENAVPSTLYGYIQMGQVKVQLELKMEEFYNIIQTSENPTAITESANSNLKVTLYTFPQGQKIAHVKWVWDNEMGFIVPYMVFSDGSEMPLSEFLPEGFNFDFDPRK